MSLPDLDRRWLDVIRHGDDSYRDARALTCAVVFAASNAGVERQLVDAMLWDAGNAASEWVLHTAGKRGRLKAEKELARIWHAARNAPAPRRRVRDLSDIVELAARSRMQAHATLKGRTSGTDLAVHEALLTLATAHRTDQPMAPQRTVALLAGVSRKTAARGLQRLVDAGLWRRVSTSGTAEADAFRVASLPQTCPSVTPARESGVLTQHPVPVTQHTPALDVWRRTDLGKSAWLVYGALRQAPAAEWTAADLARITGKHRSTVGRALRRLADRGLAEEVEEHRWVLGRSDPHNVVGAADGSHDRDAARYARERFGWQHRNHRTEAHENGAVCLDCGEIHTTGPHSDTDTQPTHAVTEETR